MAATTLEIERREVVRGGQAFGSAGAYERIAGVLRFAVDPTLPDHRLIADLERAPRNGQGRVEFWADFYLLQPVDPARGNRRLLLDVPNRGRKIALGMFNGAVSVPEPVDAEHFGNGFLMRHGYSVAWVGWQVDVPRRDGLMALGAPAARGVSGRLRCEWRPNAPVDVLPLADRYHLPYPAADLDDPEAQLTVREHAGAEPVAMPRDAWRFAKRDGDRLVPDPGHLHVKAGFAPGASTTSCIARRTRRWWGSASSPCATPRGSSRAARPRRETPPPGASIARTSSACRRAGASCATCSTSA